MKKLVDAIIKQLGASQRRLTVTADPDGLLRDGELVEAVSRRGIDVVHGSSLTLRVHFETVYKDNPDRSYIYVTNDSLLPDIMREGRVAKMSIANLFPFFANKDLLKGETASVLNALLELYPGRVSIAMCFQALSNARQSVCSVASDAPVSEYFSLDAVDWKNPDIAIAKVSQAICNAVTSEALEDIKLKLNIANLEFQKWLDSNYFARLNSSYILRPNSVDKILPFIAEKHKTSERVALVVIDGMAYWQWLLLSEVLKDKGIKFEESSTLAWIPTITKLSRQAIFRGEFPKLDYRQSTESEKKLWREYWLKRNFTFSEIQYLCDADEFAIDESTRRLALVTVEIDDKMHSSTDLSDLALLTQRWTKRFTPKIETLRNMGFTVYITSDHGGTPAKGWRQLNASEKVDLYADGSRGKRHLIYTDKDAMTRFVNANGDNLEMMKGENWIAIRDNKSFATSGNEEITHGGSHFMEVVIPFVKIPTNT